LRTLPERGGSCASPHPATPRLSSGPSSPSMPRCRHLAQTPLRVTTSCKTSHGRQRWDTSREAPSASTPDRAREHASRDPTVVRTTTRLVRRPACLP
jgi:hypothetical protein